MMLQTLGPFGGGGGEVNSWGALAPQQNQVSGFGCFMHVEEPDEVLNQLREGVLNLAGAWPLARFVCLKLQARG